MLPQIRKVGSLTGLASNKIATGKIPTFGTIYGIWLRPRAAAADTATAIANMKSELSNVVMSVNGEEWVNATPTFLLDYHRYILDQIAPGNNANLAGFLPIYAFNPLYADPVAQAAFAIGTGINPAMPDIRSIDLQVLAGTLTAACDDIEVYYSVTPERRPLGEHIRIRKFPRNFASTGEFDINTLPTLEKTALLSLHIEDGDGTITKSSIEANGTLIMDNVPNSVNNGILQTAGRSPQTGYYHAAFDITNDTDSYIDMEQTHNFRAKPYFSVAPNNFNVYGCYVHNKGQRN